MNDRNITNARFIQVSQLPEIDSHLTAKLSVDNTISDAIDEPSKFGLDPDEQLNQNSIILNSILISPKTIIELPTKNYVDKKFNDPSIIKKTHIMLTSMLKISITLDGLKLTRCQQL